MEFDDYIHDETVTETILLYKLQKICTNICVNINDVLQKVIAWLENGGGDGGGNTLLEGI